MVNTTKLSIVAIHVGLLILMATATYAYTRIRNLNVPIPAALGLFTIFLPFVTGVSLRGAAGLIRRAKSGAENQLYLPLVAIIGFQLIYETVVATLSLTYMLPPDSLACGLNEQWQSMYRRKDETAIKAIQDGLQCCGLNSLKDRAWPFITNSRDPGTRTCVELWNRTSSCFGGWRKAQQINAGLLFLVATLVFITKVVALVYLLNTKRWIYRQDIAEDEVDRRAAMRRLIEESADGPYRDEPDAAIRDNRVLENGHGNAPRVEPSLLPADNHWADRQGT